MKRFVFASSEFPSGSTLLHNVLLELDVRLEWVGLRESDADAAPFWVQTGSGEWELERKHAALSRFWPALTRRARYRFSDPVSVYATHNLSFADDVDGVILVVRNPLDALLSRHKIDGSDLDWDAFAGSPWRNVYSPVAFQPRIPPTEFWALHTLLWKGASDRVVVVNFEQLKRDPVPIVQRVLELLGVERSLEEVLGALAASTFESMRAAEQEYLKESGVRARPIFRKGRPGEWKALSPDLVRKRLTGAARHALSQLDGEYRELLESVPTAAEGPDPGRTFSEDRESVDAARLESREEVLDAVRLSSEELAKGEWSDDELIERAAHLTSLQWTLAVVPSNKKSLARAYRAMSSVTEHMDRGPVALAAMASALNELRLPDPALRLLALAETRRTGDFAEDRSVGCASLGWDRKRARRLLTEAARSCPDAPTLNKLILEVLFTSPMLALRLIGEGTRRFGGSFLKRLVRRALGDGRRWIASRLQGVAG